MSRGLVADPAQILIVSGVQEGLNLVARLFPATTVFVEDPGYQGASAAFAAAGARSSASRVDEEGLETSLLPEAPGALLYVTPGHQYPTGQRSRSRAARSSMAWARRNGCYLVEDDYDSEFQYDGAPLQALAGMAPDCTIHLGTFSTTLGAGVKLGYVVAPPALVDAMRAAKALFSGGRPWLDQAVLAEFLKSGSYATHLTRSRAQYKESRDALLGALRRHFGTVEMSGEAAGLHVFWRLPAGVPEAAQPRGARARRTMSASIRPAVRGRLRARARRRSTAAASSWATPACCRGRSSRGSRGSRTPSTTRSTATTTSFASSCSTSPLPEGPRSGARARASARRPLQPASSPPSARSRNDARARKRRPRSSARCASSVGSTATRSKA